MHLLNVNIPLKTYASNVENMTYILVRQLWIEVRDIGNSSTDKYIDIILETS